MTQRHALNAPGPWYVDTRCIDCGASRTVAPGLIVERGGQSVFARQPVTAQERMAAWRARLLCPTASVRSESHVGSKTHADAKTHVDEKTIVDAKTLVDVPAGIFPEEMTQSVYRLGYNARSSWGAHSFLICRRAGNVMVDAPRWSSQLVAALASRGGLCDILLTHRDDVADAGRYAARFGARVWIHEADRDAAPFADKIVAGSRPVALAADLLVIPVPGHTEGSVVYLYDRRCLFTGDSLAWSFEQDDLTAFRDACWWSWPQQRRSLRRLLDYEFEWVLAGHGGSRQLPAAEMRTRLAALVERMGRTGED